MVTRPKQSEYRRGFKADAQRIANEVRRELGLGPLHAMPPHRLAEHLAIQIVPLRSLDAPRDAVTHFVASEPSAFSAVTVFRGSERIVVYNDAHAPARQSSDITHELAHALLMHPTHVAVDAATGCRVFHPDIEREAEFLSGVLLVPDAAAVTIVRTGQDVSDAAHHYGVSRQMVIYRINISGARNRGSSRGAPFVGRRAG